MTKLSAKAMALCNANVAYRNAFFRQLFGVEINIGDVNELGNKITDILITPETIIIEDECGEIFSKDFA